MVVHTMEIINCVFQSCRQQLQWKLVQSLWDGFQSDWIYMSCPCKEEGNVVLDSWNPSWLLHWGTESFCKQNVMDSQMRKGSDTFPTHFCIKTFSRVQESNLLKEVQEEWWEEWVLLSMLLCPGSSSPSHLWGSIMYQDMHDHCGHKWEGDEPGHSSIDSETLSWSKRTVSSSYYSTHRMYKYNINPNMKYEMKCLHWIIVFSS